MESDERENIPSQVRKKRSNRISILNEEFDLSLFMLITQKRWKLLVSIFLVSIAIAATYLRYAQRVYEESCVIQVNSQNTANKLLSLSATYGGGNENEEEAVEFMRSRLFLERVFRVLPMSISYYTEGTFKNNERYLTSPYSAEVDSVAQIKLVRVPIYIHFNSLSGGKLTFAPVRGAKHTYPFFCGQWCETPYGKINIKVIIPSEITKSVQSIKKDADFFRINDYNDLANYYSKQITVKIMNADAKTILISCRDEDDFKAAAIANTIGQQFKFEILRKRKQSDESILSFINQQLDTIYSRIRETERTLGDTIKKNRGNTQSQELLNANGSYLASLDNKISTLEINEKLLNDIAQKIKDEKDIDPLNLVMQLSVIEESGTGALKNNVEILSNLINQRQSARFDATDANTKVLEYDSLIKQQKDLIFKSFDLLNQEMNSTRNDYVAQRDNMESKFLTPAAVENLENLRLQKQASIDEKYYDLLLEKKAEYSISKAGYVPESEILENAIPYWIPVSPKKSVTMIIAILVATAVCIVMLVIIYMFYNNITSIYEIEKLTESPITILGIIPKYTKEIPASQIIVNHNPKSILAESFRSIRTNLQFISNETEAKVISITSTVSGEGKTFVCVNLGGIIAYSGKKVIVLDLDMRRPRIHTAFGLDNSKGMSTLLIGKYQVEDVIQKTENENLHIITAGPIPPNPSELVISKTMDDILTKLKSLYDIIIVDNPPVGLVTDGISMLQRADYPIYLMRVDYSKREFIYFVDRLYYENQFHKLSIILNGVDFRRQKYGYSYYKYGYYGYGYGYTYGHGNYYET